MPYQQRDEYFELIVNPYSFAIWLKRFRADPTVRLDFGKLSFEIDNDQRAGRDIIRTMNQPDNEDEDNLEDEDDTDNDAFIQESSIL